MGRKWLTTQTAVLQWLEPSATPRPSAAQETALAHAIAHGDTAALVEAVRTGQARLGTKVQHTARSDRVPGGDKAREPRLTLSRLVPTTASQTLSCRVLSERGPCFSPWSFLMNSMHETIGLFRPLKCPHSTA